MESRVWMCGYGKEMRRPRDIRCILDYTRSCILGMFSTMLSGGGGNRRATSLGKGHLSQAAAARLARTSSWNDGLDGAGIPTTPSTNNETTTTTTFSSSSAATATGHHSILRVADESTRQQPTTLQQLQAQQQARMRRSSMRRMVRFRMSAGSTGGPSADVDPINVSSASPSGEGGVDGDGHLSGTKSCNGQPPHYPSANDGADAISSSASVRNECRALGGGGGGGHKSLNESLGNVGSTSSSSSSSSSSSTSSSSGDERSSRAAVPLLWQPMNKQQPLMAMMEETSNSSSRSSAASPFPPPLLLPPPPFSSSSISSSASTSCQRSGAIPTAFVSPAVSTSESLAAGSRSASDATATRSYSSSTFQVESEQEPTNRWPSSATNNSATAAVSHPPTASPVHSSGPGREVLVRQVSRFSVMQTSLDGDQQQLSSSSAAAAAGTAGDSLATPPPPSGDLRDPCSSSSATSGVHRPLTSSSSNQSRRQRGRSGRTREGGAGGGGGGHSRARRQRSNMSAASGTSRASTVSSPDTPIVRSQRSPFPCVVLDWKGRERAKIASKVDFLSTSS
ncbi:hypothetical protein DAPPUDRAFT_94560 [Daphnia pulex]|uniref:Uncharacterized protein n=1 Tax=Daphnia pulex TaxID=6669 RepID=E9FSD4_DAPPU|nr:hypothetical protein DAPPUDRAFT_94560 [Daphnia pulex]|eukprot:EFX89853.1 hypothetical protein DAPPUDRAFT_94560 [Daphnia pulex]